MRQKRYPILEFDPTREAIIEPSKVYERLDVPEHCLLCFFQEVITRLCNERKARLLMCQKSQMGERPVYELNFAGNRLALIHPGVGAPSAAIFFEEIIARGCRKFIACGAGGVLDGAIAAGRLVVPVAAIRDEGVSYHYVPPAREIKAGPDGITAVEKVLKAHARKYLLGKTWTTDAFYRETPAKIALRKSEGCVTVDMEAAALFAVAQFRGVTFAQILYSGDDVGGDEWSPRGWDQRTLLREQIFWLAAEACLAL